MNFKKAILRFAALMLSCLMVISIPLTALADGNVNQNANSGGSVAAGSNAVYAHKFFAYPCNQGWRFTIVNKQGDPVSNSVDAVVYFPTDINGILNADKTPTISGSTGSTSELLAGYKKYKDWIGWKKYSGKNKLTELWISNGIKTTPFSAITWNRNGVPDTKRGNLSIRNKVYPLTVLNGFLRASIIDQIKSEGGTPNESEIMQLAIPVPSILNGSSFSPGGALLKETAMKAMSELTTDGKDLKSNLIKAILNSKIQVYDNTCKPTGQTDYLFRYMDPSDNNSIGTKNAAGETIFVSTIFTEKQYRLAVEPLYFGIPEVVTTDISLIQKYRTSKIGANRNKWLKMPFT